MVLLSVSIFYQLGEQYCEGKQVWKRGDTCIKNPSCFHLFADVRGSFLQTLVWISEHLWTWHYIVEWSYLWFGQSFMSCQCTVWYRLYEMCDPDQRGHDATSFVSITPTDQKLRWQGTIKIVRWSQLVVCMQGRQQHNIIDKRKTLGPTDGNSSYIAGCKLTLEPDDNALRLRITITIIIHVKFYFLTWQNSFVQTSTTSIYDHMQSSLCHCLPTDGAAINSTWLANRWRCYKQYTLQKQLQYNTTKICQMLSQ